MIIVGVDPGMSGAIAAINERGHLLMLEDMPVMQKGSGKKQQVNPAGLVEMLNDFATLHVGGVFLERVSAMPRQGVSSTFAFGESFGVVRGVVAAMGYPLEFVTPQCWKRRFGLIGKDKDAARTVAIELYPRASLARKKDVGRADALLIARYGWESMARAA